MAHGSGALCIGVLSCMCVVAGTFPSFGQGTAATPSVESGSATAPLARREINGTGVNVFESLNPEPPTETVTNTPGADSAQDPYAVKGIKLGQFQLVPVVTVATFFDDNVFALSHHPLGDWAFVARPSFTLRSTSLKDADLLASGFVEFRRYDEFTTEDQNNGAVGLAGQKLLNQNTQIVGRAEYIHGHEDRGASDTITTEFFEPIAYDQGDGAVALNNRWGRYWTSIGASALDIQYANGILFGVPISQDYRSGDIEQYPVRAGYVVAPLTSVFVEGAFNTRNFEVGSFSSDGYRIVGGALWEPGQGARLKGEVYGGYINQDYSGLTLLPVSTWTAGGSLAWLATQKLIVGLEGRRDAREASLSGGVIPNDGVSVIESVAILRADYQVRQNVVIAGGISYIADQYLGARRTDSAWSPLASARWFINPMFTLGFDYRNVAFDSTGFGIEPYRRNVYLMTLDARF
jgi:hypothetical protein